MVTSKSYLFFLSGCLFIQVYTNLYTDTRYTEKENELQFLSEQEKAFL